MPPLRKPCKEGGGDMRHHEALMLLDEPWRHERRRDRGSRAAAVGNSGVKRRDVFDAAAVEHVRESRAPQLGGADRRATSRADRAVARACLAVAKTQIVSRRQPIPMRAPARERERDGGE